MRRLAGRIQDGQDGHLAEMLRITAVFISIKGVDIHAKDASDRTRALTMARDDPW
jgi:hypothetical protein